MAAAKYVGLSSGVLTEVAAVVTSSGAGDDGKIIGLDSTGKISTTMMPVGIGADTKSIVTSENLAAGDLVNIYDATGTPTARKADASNGRKATGFVLVSSTSGNNALVYFEGTITGLTGLTAGTQMYLSGSTAGAATATAPSTASYIVQDIGQAISDTEISFEPQRPITLA